MKMKMGIIGLLALWLACVCTGAGAMEVGGMGAGGGASTQTHVHCVCGDLSCDGAAQGHGIVAYEPLGADKTQNGKGYYLTENMTTSGYDDSAFGNGTSDEPVFLCLNGHSITRQADGNAVVALSTLFVLSDCNGSGAGNGVITHASGKTGSGIYAYGDVTMWGGTISGNTVKDNGGGVFAKGDVTISGGTISQNKALTRNSDGSSIGGNGGGVCAVGNVTITGGTIGGENSDTVTNGNTAHRYGGGIYAKGSVTITGGEINGNIAEYGGGVSADKNVRMWDGTISQNWANNGSGGGAFAKGSVTIRGGRIEKNRSNANGGGVAADKNVTMWGGTIAENDAEFSGSGAFAVGNIEIFGGAITQNRLFGEYGHGGVYAKNCVTIGGDVQITGNKNHVEEHENVYLPNGKQMLLASPLTGDARIGVTTQSAPAAGKPVKYMTPGTGTEIDAGSMAATCSDKGYSTMLDGGDAWLYVPFSYTPPTAIDDLTENGSAQALVEPGACSADGMTIQYALGSEREPIGSWSGEIPTGTDAGEYYVWYRIRTADNEPGAAPAYVAVRIAASAADSDAGDAGAEDGSSEDAAEQQPQSLPNLPRTGDASSLLGWLALLGASCAGLRARRKK